MITMNENRIVNITVIYWFLSAFMAQGLRYLIKYFE